MKKKLLALFLMLVLCLSVAVPAGAAEISYVIDELEVLTSEEIDGWRYRTLDYFEGKESEHRNEIRYLTEERIKKFIDSSDLRLDEYMTPLLSREKMTV